MIKSILFVFLLLSSFSFSQIEGKKSLVQDPKLARGRDQYLARKEVWIALTTPLPGAQIANGGALIELGADFRASSSIFGSVDADYSYSIFVTETNEDPGFYPVTKVSRSNFTISYGAPLFKIKGESKALKTERHGKRYATIVEPQNVSVMEMRFGFEKKYLRTVTRGHYEWVNEIYPDAWYLGHASNEPTAFLDQSITQLHIGPKINFWDKSNTSMRGSTFKRNLSSLHSVFSELKYGLNTDVALNRYKYGPLGNPMGPFPVGSNYQTIEYTVDLSNYTNYIKLGFGLGYEFFWQSSRRPFFATKFIVELGTDTGYHDSIVSTLYLNFKFISIGFGHLTGKADGIVKKKEKEL